MKRTLIKVTVMGILLAGGIYLMEEKSTPLSDVALENIEALAGGEEPVIQRCYSSGSLVCPINNSKVEYIVEHYGLQ